MILHESPSLSLASSPGACQTCCNMRGIGTVFGVFNALLQSTDVAISSLASCARSSLTSEVFSISSCTQVTRAIMGLSATATEHNLRQCHSVIPISWHSTAMPWHVTSQNSSRARLADLRHSRNEESCSTECIYGPTAECFLQYTHCSDTNTGREYERIMKNPFHEQYEQSVVQPRSAKRLADLRVFR